MTHTPARPVAGQQTLVDPPGDPSVYPPTGSTVGTSLQPLSLARPGARRRPSRSRLLRRRPAGDWASVALASLAAVVVCVVHSRGMYTAPVRFDDEGTYVSQARSLLDDGLLAPYTYWYDHPPLGWMLLAAWMAGPGLLLDAPNVIGSGRQLMLVTDVASVLLIFLLVRRLGMSRLAGVGAALLFGLSPVALSYHRMVLLDNIATPLLLAAMVLALSPARRLVAAFGAGVTLGAAVLVKETVLLLVPFVAWLLWRNANPRTRRMTVVVGAVGLAMTTMFYPLYALLKGELLPGRDHVSLWDAVVFQLVGRTSSGSVLDSSSDAHSIVQGWLQLDPYLLLAGAVVCVPALLVREVRPVAAALAFLLLMMLRPGYLPVPYVVALLPLAAVVVVAVAETVVRWVPLHRLRTERLRLGDAVLAVVVVTGLAVLASMTYVQVRPHWYYRDQALMQNNFDAPYQQSTRWITTQVPKGSTVLVDNVTRTDLLEAGYPEDDVVWFTKLDVDPEVVELHPEPGSFDYVVSTDIMRTSREAGPSLQQALEDSRPVASFGTGSRKIVIKELQ